MTTQSVSDSKQGTRQQAEPTRNGMVYRPLVDILEKADELVILADMPGVDPDDIDVQFENRSLTIYGRVRPRHDDAAGCLLREYGVGDYYRVFQVSEEVDSREIHAECKEGVLMLHLPKSEAVKPRKIAVSNGK
jgi:HSP20 family protein